jgi:hypothetical protein
MKKILILKQLIFCLAIILSDSILAQPQIGGLSKPSFKQMVADFKEDELVQNLFRSTSVTLNLNSEQISELKRLTNLNGTAFAKYKTAFLQSQPFVRGEIEDEKVLSRILVTAQYSILQFRNYIHQNKLKEALAELTPWMVLSSDLPFEESSLISLRLGALIRSLVLDEIEALEKAKLSFLGTSAESGLQWVKEVKAPWPVDRVILSEARRLKNKRSAQKAEKVAQILQKDIYITSIEALKRSQGEGSVDLAFIKEIWRAKDIEQMKEEVSRLSAMQIRWAALAFEFKNNKKATSLQNLVDQKLLASVPIDYRTGEAFTLDKAALR